jgi:hypothetical protein
MLLPQFCKMHAIVLNFVFRMYVVHGHFNTMAVSQSYESSVAWLYIRINA